MVCKLCNKNTSLIKKSHILPNFMYNGLFDDAHFIHYQNFLDPYYHKKLPDGIYQKNILCRNCDGVILGRLETYVSQVLYNRSGIKQDETPEFHRIINADGLKAIHIKQLNYTKFKLFLLSLLWRVHLSEHEFFKNIFLDDYIFESIRIMIIDNNALEDYNFETCMIYLKTENPYVKSIVTPRIVNTEKGKFYVFAINKIMYFFNISKYSDNFISKGKITTKNEMIIPILENSHADKFFQSYLGSQIQIFQN